MILNYINTLQLPLKNEVYATEFIVNFNSFLETGLFFIIVLVLSCNFVFTVNTITELQKQEIG